VLAVPYAGGASKELMQGMLALHLDPPLLLVPFVHSLTRTVPWSHSGALGGGILCFKAVLISWRVVGGELPFFSCQGFTRKIPYELRILTL